jgi:uncharacterized membrane protein
MVLVVMVSISDVIIPSSIGGMIFWISAISFILSNTTYVGVLSQITLLLMAIYGFLITAIGVLVNEHYEQKMEHSVGGRHHFLVKMQHEPKQLQAAIGIVTCYFIGIVLILISFAIFHF